LKNSDFYSIFHSTTVTANLFEKIEMLPEMCLAYKNKKCSLHSSMDNPNTLTFLGNVQWMLANKCFFLIWYGKFKSTIFRHMFIERMSNNCKTVLSIVFFIIQLSLNDFLNFDMANLNQHYFQEVMSEILSSNSKKWFLWYFSYATVTVYSFQILEMLLAMCLTYRIKCFSSILDCPIQIYHHF